MSVNLLENLDLLLRLQPVAVHQQADDVRQVDAEKPGSLGNVFVAGLLCGFVEPLVAPAGNMPLSLAQS